VSAANTKYLNLLQEWYPGLSADECYCRNVIDYVAVTLGGRSERNAIVARLKAEFQREQRRGPVHLPA
jgi:hypothetical protein